VGNALENINHLCKGVFEVCLIEAPLRGKASLEEMIRALERHDDFAAFIFEPLVQGVRGMYMQDEKVLDAMIGLAKEKKILCIADEVMTGFGRTGKMFAIDHLVNKPDILCLAKALTGGTLPLAVTLCTKDVYEPFLSDDISKTFLYGHSYAGNSLGCAAAMGSLDILEKRETQESIENIKKWHLDFLKEVSGNRALEEVRAQGTILALEFKSGQKGYFSEIGPQMKKFFLERRVLLRPLGDVLYIMPPYCCKKEDLSLAYSAVLDFLKEIK
jgi:adenosylmethionine-8-amino-7-oxononanoate aminotransferase